MFDMKRVLLFGGTGHLGKKIAAELKKRNYETTAIVRSQAKAAELENTVDRCVVADVTQRAQLENICENFQVVVSSLGKSVSPNDKSKATFFDVDFTANSNILREALKGKVKKFVYVSALDAEKYPHLEYFKTHHDFSEQLKNSGLDYSIIKPPAIFSAFLDLMLMAKKGQLINIGAGDKLTNPIYEGDLANITVDSIDRANAVIEAGGVEILSRRQINEIIQNTIRPQKKVRTVPLGLFKFALPLIKIFDKNSFDKFAFFVEVTQHDTVATQIGEMRLEEYVRRAASTVN